MSTRHRNRGLLAALVLALVLAAGCDRTDEATLRFPLDDLLDRDEEFAVERQSLVEKEVTRCMTSLGFSFRSESAVAEEQPAATGSPIRLDGESEDLQDHDDQGLTYEVALHGPIGGPPAGAIVSDDPAGVGCYNASWVRLFGEDAVSARAEIFEALVRMDIAVESDPAVVEAERRASICVEEAPGSGESSNNGVSVSPFDECRRRHVLPVALPIRSRLQIEAVRSGDLDRAIGVVEADIAAGRDSLRAAAVGHGPAGSSDQDPPRRLALNP